MEHISVNQTIDLEFVSGLGEKNCLYKLLVYNHIFVVDVQRSNAVNETSVGGGKTGLTASLLSYE